jgi:hypothetical protein
MSLVRLRPWPPGCAINWLLVTRAPERARAAIVQSAECGAVDDVVLPAAAGDLQRTDAVAQFDAAAQRPAALQAEQQGAAEGVAAAGGVDDLLGGHTRDALARPSIQRSQPSWPSVTITPFRSSFDIASSVRPVRSHSMRPS